jgi:hypothetical protein
MSRPHDHSAAARINYSNYTIRNRTRDLLSYSAVPSQLSYRVSPKNIGITYNVTYYFLDFALVRTTVFSTDLRTSIYAVNSANLGVGSNYPSYPMDVIFHNSSRQMLKHLIFVVPSIMLYSSEISSTRCNNCVFIVVK